MANNEPMTDERLAEIRHWYSNPFARSLMTADMWAIELLAEVERLRADKAIRDSMLLEAAKDCERQRAEIARLHTMLSQTQIRELDAADETEALEAQIAAMRPIVAAVAEGRILLTPTLLIHDDGSRVEGPMLEHLDWPGDTEASVRVWRQARAFVAAHPAAGEGE